MLAVVVAISAKAKFVHLVGLGGDFVLLCRSVARARISNAQIGELVKIQAATGTTTAAALDSAMRRLETEFTGLQSSFREEIKKRRAEEENIGGGV